MYEEMKEEGPIPLSLFPKQVFLKNMVALYSSIV